MSETKKVIADKTPFTFEISLSVLNHLGRNLYRSFVTVLGEAISNAWDADANNVWIRINREKGSFIIKDDGDGMTPDDFQNKFLKIGYSKRKDGTNVSTQGRPFIGRKGIGKLAMLSCAKKITIISKVRGGEYVGGIVDNSGLDDAIKEDLTPRQYLLGTPDMAALSDLLKDHEKGTIIYFEDVKDGIRNRLDHVRKIIALYFRFSLLDPSFTIYLNDDPVRLDNLADLAEKTQFVWNINGLDDPFIKEKTTHLLKPIKAITMSENIRGFIASVEKPRDLKITDTDEKVTVDLFVNGRLRERDLLKHIPTERVVVSYLYGQIHINDLDDDKDRFTSSREGIVADDPRFLDFLKSLKEKLQEIIFEDWDRWRLEKKKKGDPENPRLSSRDRSSIDLYNAVSEEYLLPEATEHPEKRELVEKWVDDLAPDAHFNFSSYAECFISENLVREYIVSKNIQLTTEARGAIDTWKQREITAKSAGNISIQLRENNVDLTYLDMTGLCNLVDRTGTQNDLATDSKQYKPIRDALMHTALLTAEAKRKLNSVYENIKGRLKTLLST